MAHFLQTHSLFPHITMITFQSLGYVLKRAAAFMLCPPSGHMPTQKMGGKKWGEKSISTRLDVTSASSNRLYFLELGSCANAESDKYRGFGMLLGPFCAFGAELRHSCDDSKAPKSHYKTESILSCQIFRLVVLRKPRVYDNMGSMVDFVSIPQSIFVCRVFANQSRFLWRSLQIGCCHMESALDSCTDSSRGVSFIHFFRVLV